MVNDTTTLNGALSELGETMAANITTKGVSASASDGLTTLAGKILQISGGGGGPTTLFEDDFNRSSLGSNWIAYGTNGNASISNNQLVLSRSGDGRGGIYYDQYITGDYKVTIELAGGDYDTYAIGLQTSGTGWTLYEVQPKWYFGYITINSGGTISSSLHEQRTSGITYTSATIVYEVIQDTSIKMYINDTLEGTYNCQDGTTDGYVGVTQCCNRSTTINSIKVESLGGGSDCSQYTTQINNAIEYINGSGS